MEIKKSPSPQNGPRSGDMRTRNVLVTLLTISTSLALMAQQAPAPTAPPSPMAAPQIAPDTPDAPFAIVPPFAGYSISFQSPMAAPFVETDGDPWQLLQGSKSYLGVDIKDITSERVSALKLKDEHGVEVTAVDQDAPAGKAGLKEHDVILEYNGQRVEGEEQLRRMIRETPPGRTVTLGVSREGQVIQLKATLGDHSKMDLPK